MGSDNPVRGSVVSVSENDSLDSMKDPRLLTTVDDVKVIPPKMIFGDAYDGKVFKQSFSLINCGKYPAFVRILAPSSNAFKMKTIPKGLSISSGLRITTKIFYTHSSATALHKACLVIYINEKPILYQIEVNLISPHVTLTPNLLDFGEVDVRTASDAMSLHLCNKGHKITQFRVDLGRHNLEIIVDPMKGYIRPLEDVEIKVEILSYKQGFFTEEFWIKTNPPQRVNIRGTFIESKLVIEHPFTKFKFALIDFPRTYYGAVVTRTLVIRNNSSAATMFCIISENGTNTEFLKTAMETNEHLKCFQIVSKEGRLLAQQSHILQFRFVPTTAKKLPQMFSLVFLRIVKVPYRDGIIVDEDVEAKTFADTDSSYLLSMSSLQVFQEFYMEDEEDEEVEEVDENYLRVCLYAEMEEARIKLIPESFTIAYLKPHVKYSYELNIRNISQHLPISIQYNKSTCVEIEPKKITLGPNSSMDVTLSLKPTKIGQSGINVTFDLIYEDKQERYKVGTACLPVNYIATMTRPVIKPKFNMGITPRVTNEVGILCDDVRFNSAIDKPVQAIVDKNYRTFNKYNNDIIAFPNDRPQSLRPWKNKDKCRTIYANIPRFANAQDKYNLNDAEQDLKNFTSQFYTDFIRSKAKKRHTNTPYILPHYSITKEKRILMEGVYYSDCSSRKVVSKIHNSAAVPLPPENLLKVRIEPKIVMLGKIAPYTMTTDSFCITNDNEFAIHVFIKALSNSIAIKGKEMLVLAPKTTKNISFDCWSYGLGKYYVPVFILVNCHIFDAMIYAKVVPPTVVCAIEEIFIKPKQNCADFEIHNPVNCDINFSWEIQDTNFKMYPMSGTIPHRKSLLCRLTFLLQIESVFNTEIYLISQNGVKQIIKVTRENVKPTVGFDTHLVKFENIPLNFPVSREITLMNFSDVEIVFKINNENFNEITVIPIEGKLHPKSEKLFEIVAHFKDVVKFYCSIEFILQNVYSYIVEIEGNVIFPEICLQPEAIQIPKIASGAYQRRVIKVTNISKAQSSIHVCLEDFPELFITDLNKNIVHEIILEPQESRELFIEFKPVEAIVYSLFIPFLLNGIIGPPILNIPSSVQPKSYFQDINDDFREAVELPETLPVIKLKCGAGAPWIKMSSLDIDFQFNNRQRNTKCLNITNISSVGHRVTIPLVDPQYPFHYTIEKAQMYDVNEKYCNVFIEPEEQISFVFEFTPAQAGTYNTELPLFVDKSTNFCAFNYIRLSGSLVEPHIIASKSVLYHQIIWPKGSVSDDLYLDLIAHEEDCHVYSEVFDETLSVNISDKTIVDDVNTRIQVSVTFAPKTDCFIESKIIFKCGCGVSYNLIVKAAADSCYFGSYESCLRIKAELSDKKFESTFPYFPRLSDESFYAVEMKVILENLEYWLYSQGFFYKRFIKIPYHMQRVSLDIPRPGTKESSTRKKSPLPKLPLVILLINLTSPTAVKYFDDGTLTPVFQDVEGTVYMYATYRNILRFLKSQKVFVPQLEPEYLLPYNLYVIFKKQIDDPSASQQPSYEDKMLSRDDFYYFSTQCWLDLLLRIYKVFVFDRAVGPVTSTNLRDTDIYREEFKKYYSKYINTTSDRYILERKLLLWIEFHFEKQKSVLWDIKQHKHLQNYRQFKSFEADLRDGLAFATLLVAYCPYMKKFLQNFYPSFENEVQMFHNFCLINDALKLINVSYLLTPPHLIKPSAAEMKMFVAYLYNVLPGFLPTETLTFEASLGGTSSHEIILTNPGTSLIVYTPIFFKNYMNNFEVNCESIIIPPKKETVVKITYNAKSILKIKTFLVLSGETQGFKYSTSKAIVLIGIARVFDFTEEYKFNVDIYVPVKQTIEIYSPYEKPYEGKVYFYLGDYDKIPENTNEFFSMSSLHSQNIPRQIYIEDRCVFDSEGSATLNIQFCYVSNGEYSYCVYFLNEEVGHFCIKINILICRGKENSVEIEVPLPLYFSTSAPCLCKQKTSDHCYCFDRMAACARSIKVEIPYKNCNLIEGLRSIFRFCVDKDESEYWNLLLETPKGFHVLRNYLANTFDDIHIKYKHVLNTSVTYKVDLQKKKINVPATLTFEDVTSSGFCEMYIHWNRSEQPQEENLILYADHGQEIREYRLIFRPPNINNVDYL